GLLLRVDRVDGQLCAVLALQGHGLVGEVLGGLIPRLQLVDLPARVSLDEVKLYIELPALAALLKEGPRGMVCFPGLDRVILDENVPADFPLGLELSFQLLSNALAEDQELVGQILRQEGGLHF